MRSKSYLSNLYIGKDLSMREIARQLNVGHSTIIEAFKRLGIQKNSSNNNTQIPGQIPFGYSYKNGKLEKNEKEQEVIGTIKQLKSNGLSLRGIARELNQKLIPTKNNGIWHANTLSKILERVSIQKIV
ncbi:MAG: recombinase family protein [Candidatus Heimdallarchaeaceae archaeon]